ncbi:2-phospho-L-lactate guanylyltransferase [Candidatus Solirubrobacter pratensis]|uniref:2-phospho-L-lactate guanylyltransferase n=1 Tax=Candidatus Solirubrobacter pratensis TaxID=1298857 RepID=UPI000427E163|nr:2-phospho-L-lactate guanylyltransferase [Candidatus Solirubrobacter pratensis]
MRTAAVLPVKSFGIAKSRLGSAFPHRPTLAEAMVGDVLAALGQVPGLDDVIVVTAEPAAARAADAAGAHVVHDPEEAGQSAAASRGIDAAVERGAGRALLVPGDCPALNPAEVMQLLARTAAVVIVPDRHGTGTNALLLTPPSAIAPAFGTGSFARHSALAGGRAEVCEVPSLRLDVDTPDDLQALRAALAAHAGGAPRTRALLDAHASAAA